MSDASTVTYRAFISYSHADTRWSKWLHRQLESFNVDKSLASDGEGSEKTLPTGLRPIFRDRDEFAAGRGLAEQTMSALDRSGALVVICSPAAAKSHYVNEEVRLFRSRNPERPVIPVIVDGEPGSGDRECFPAALAFKVSSEGEVTDAPAEVLAADVREEGDGPTLALAKVVARLLELDTDKVYRRAERARRVRRRTTAGIAATFVALGVAVGLFAWLDYQKRQTLAEIEELVKRYSPVGSAQAAAPAARQSLSEAITSIAQGATRDPRYAEALELLKAGKPKQAEPLLKAVAEDKVKLADVRKKEAAEAYRNLASIAGLTDTQAARKYYAEAARLDPDNLNVLANHALAQQMAGNSDVAEKAFKRLLEIGARTGAGQSVYMAHLGLGNIYSVRGELVGAAEQFEKARVVIAELQKASPGDTYLKAFHFMSLDGFATALKAKGDLAKAEETYVTAFKIVSELVAKEPGNRAFQFGLANSHLRLAELKSLTSDYDGALKDYAAGFKIATRHAALEPSNFAWLAALGLAERGIATCLREKGRHAEALARAHSALERSVRLAGRDAENVVLQVEAYHARDVVTSIYLAQGDDRKAIESLIALTELAARIGATGKATPDWEHNLVIDYSKLAMAQRRVGDKIKSLKALNAGRAIVARLLARSPDNAKWQRDLAWYDAQISGAAQ